MDLTAQIAQIVHCTEAEGPGKRFALWFQGCPLRCPDCCNPEFLPFKGGDTRTIGELEALLGEAVEMDIEGVSLLGGEPFTHAAPAAAFAEIVQACELSVMVYSGYTIEQLYMMPDPAVGQLLTHTDILVDGPYIRELPDTERRWIGSTNQRIHFLTDRYTAEDPCWRQRNTLELRVRGAEVAVNGFPAAGAVGLWKGWKRKAP